MDEADFILRTLHRCTVCGFVVALSQHLLLVGLVDLALQSPSAWERMEFLTPVLGNHPFDIYLETRWYICCGFALLCSLIPWIPVLFNRSQAEIFISRALNQQYRTRAVFCICLWINVSARLIAGENWFFVSFLSSSSVASVSAFMLVESSRDSLVLAWWAMAQSIVVAVNLVFEGNFLQAGVSTFPILPAICAVRNSSRKEKRSKTSERNQSIDDTAQMVEEGEGFCGHKSNG